VASLKGSPVPAWVPSAGASAALCMLAVVAANVWNWGSTECPMELFRKGGEARFIVLAAIAYAVAGLAEIALACPVIAERTGLTLAGAGVRGLFLHGFVGSALLGAIYYILPRVLQVRWPKENLVNVHFGLQAAGAILIFVGLGLGGVVQGGRLADAKVPFLTIAQGAAPFLGISTLGLLLLLAGQAVWILNLVQLVRGFIEPAARGLCAELCGCGTTAKAGVKS
jgi:cytochrome c oxidase cbb3-type subunit 1